MLFECRINLLHDRRKALNEARTATLWHADSARQSAATFR